MAQPLAFSQFLLTVDDRFATNADLAPFKAKKGTILPVESTDYFIEEVEELPNGYFWVYIRFGTSSPRSDDVYNKVTASMESNPRTIEQSELKGQLFVVYDPNRFTLFISNANKKGFVQKAIMQETGSAVEIKSIIIDVEEFIEKTKIVRKVELIKANNLINSTDETFGAPTDCLGLGMPTEATLSAEFNKKPTERFFDFLRNFKSEKSKLKYKGMVCIGRDDKNFEFTFNTENFQQKINLAAQREENGLYNAEGVRAEVVMRIQDL